MSKHETWLVEQVAAFLRAESTKRKKWRRLVWLGRRAVAHRLEQTIQARHWGQIRADDHARHFLIDAVIDSIEACNALDLGSAGRWAEEVYEDPIEATEPIAIWRGQKAPLTTEELAARSDPRLNRRRP